MWKKCLLNNNPLLQTNSIPRSNSKIKLKMPSSLNLYRTSELSPQQIEGICSLFEETFHRTKTPEQFLHQFSNTGFPGGSYHILLEKDEKIYATYSLIPYRYRVKGTVLNGVLGCDKIASPGNDLGIGCVLKMHRLAEKILAMEGFSFLYGCPNDNAFNYDSRVVRMKSVCDLDFYVLPINLAKVFKILILIQWLYYPCIWLAMQMLKVFASSRQVSFQIEKVDDEQFRNSRYDNRHHRIQVSPKTEAVYTIYYEGKVPVAYILDFTPVSPRGFYETFIKVASLLKKEAAIIVYPANYLPFFTPLRIPRRFLPRKLHLLIQEFDRKSDLMSTAKDWNFNLSNFDVR